MRSSQSGCGTSLSPGSTGHSRPRPIAVFDAECRKTGRVKPCADVGMEGVRKEGFEIHNLLGAVIKLQANACSAVTMLMVAGVVI